MNFKKTIFLPSLLCICLLLIGVYFLQSSNPGPSLEQTIHKMLTTPKDIQKIEKMEGGFSNDIWQVYTEDKKYILREKSRKVKTASFIKDLEIAKKASFHGVGPEVIGVNIRKQQMLIEYIDNISWPTYEENSKPYKDTMQALRTFHEKMPSATPLHKTALYTPFEYILRVGQRLEKAGKVPKQYSFALKMIKELFKELKPWLKKNATLCHGDFCKQNVLLSPSLTPTLIDFDSSSIGDPFFDLVKFSLSLLPHQRQELFQEYLGSNSPSLEQQRHFQIADLTLLMLISTIRFNFAENGEMNDILSKQDMELLLESSSTLPSFFEIPFEDTSPKARQLGALYALAEFLNKQPLLK